jgi:hypothetical protein
VRNEYCKGRADIVSAERKEDPGGRVILCNTLGNYKSSLDKDLMDCVALARATNKRRAGVQGGVYKMNAE